MRGVEGQQEAMFSYVSLEHRVPKKHPLRTIRKLVDAALLEMDGALTAMYSHTGRPSIPPERMKSFRRKDDDALPPSGGSNVEVDFRGEKRSNETHESKTDPECRLYRKGPGQESKLAYLGHALMENRNGLAVDGCVTQADGYGERNAAMVMIDAIKTEGEITLGADKGYDAAEFVERLGKAKVVPHIAQNTKNRRPAVPEAIAKTEGYAVSQIVRKRIDGDLRLGQGDRRHGAGQAAR